MSLSRLLLVLLVLVSPAAAQERTRQRATPGVREAMWRAPTAEEWASPCLLEFERTWEDAVAVAKEEGRPILVCVNMDGEIASEHYAGVRYRQQEIAALYEPYVKVICSVYRHTPRDHDDEGRRIECPRFGSVTCGEHIAIEPFLYENFFDGTRVAPRHIMVDVEGNEAFDIYYAFDTQSVFDAIEEGPADLPPPKPIVRGDRPILERAKSRAREDREAVEEAYANGDRDLREALIAASSEAGEDVSNELLRQAVFGLDAGLADTARGVLADASSETSVDLLNDTLQGPLPDAERAPLVSALERIGDSSDKARKLASVHGGLAKRSDVVDVGAWASTIGTRVGAAYTSAFAASAPVTPDVDAVLEAEQPDPVAHLELAEAFLLQAYDEYQRPRVDRGSAKMLLRDALETAREAEGLGADGWRPHAVVAIASYYLDDKETARARAIQAVEAGVPDDADGWNAATVLAIFTQARQEAIRAAVIAKRKWPSEWLADIDSALSVLATHPHGADSYVVSHVDFLRWLGAKGRAARVLDSGIATYPESWDLHERLRQRILERGGHDLLEPTYDKLLARPDASPSLELFAGHASFITAEHLRRNSRFEEALAAYDRAIARYDAGREALPDEASVIAELVAIAHAGRGRIYYELGDLPASRDALFASFERAPATAATPDGLGLTAVATAQMVRSTARARGLEEVANELQEALDYLDGYDPTLLDLPAYEGGGPVPPWERKRGGDGS